MCVYALQPFLLKFSILDGHFGNSAVDGFEVESCFIASHFYLPHKLPASAIDDGYNLATYVLLFLFLNHKVDLVFVESSI